MSKLCPKRMAASARMRSPASGPAGHAVSAALLCFAPGKRRCRPVLWGAASVGAAASWRASHGPWGSGHVQGCPNRRIPSPSCSGVMCTRGRQSPTLRWWDLGARWDWVLHGMGTPVLPPRTHGERCRGFSQHTVRPDAPRMLPYGAGSSSRAQVWICG